MNKRDSWARKHPALFPYGNNPKILSPDEEAGATFDMRLASIWRFLAGYIIRHNRRLNARERASLSVEDSIQGVVVALIERDEQWKAERGRYITFARVVMTHKLAAMVEQARPVILPRNSSIHLRQYKELKETGQIKEDQQYTMRSMMMAYAEHCGLENLELDSQTDSLENIEQRNLETALARRRVLELLRGLPSAQDAFVMSKLYGIGTDAPMSHQEVAANMPGYSAQQIGNIEARVKASLARKAKVLSLRSEFSNVVSSA